MSTRATVHFRQYGEDIIIYRHSDGYPEGLGQDLEQFFKDVQAQTKDTRFNDAAYLAAKWVVWDSRIHNNSSSNPDNYLDFLSVGVVTSDPSDIEYRYIVECCMAGGVPTVKCEKV